MACGKPCPMDPAYKCNSCGSTSGAHYFKDMPNGAALLYWEDRTPKIAMIWWQNSWRNCTQQADGSWAMSISGSNVPYTGAVIPPATARPGPFVPPNSKKEPVVAKDTTKKAQDAEQTEYDLLADETPADREKMQKGELLTWDQLNKRELALLRFGKL